MASTVLEIWMLSFVETGTGHVSYISTSKNEYIALTKSGYVINKFLFFPGISCAKNSDIDERDYQFAMCVAGVQRDGFFTGWILSAHQVHRDAWMAIQSDYQLAGILLFFFSK